MAKDKCFALDADGKCTVLLRKQCEDCAFYKTRKEYKRVRKMYPHDKRYADRKAIARMERK